MPLTREIWSRCGSVPLVDSVMLTFMRDAVGFTVSDNWANNRPEITLDPKSAGAAGAGLDHLFTLSSREIARWRPGEPSDRPTAPEPHADGLGVAV